MVSPSSVNSGARIEVVRHARPMVRVGPFASGMMPRLRAGRASVAIAPYPKTAPSLFGRHLAIPEPSVANELATVSAEFLER